MLEKSLNEVLTNIESELSFAKVQLSKVEDTIRSVQRVLGTLIQTIESPSMQNDTLVSKSQKKLSKDATSTCGEKQNKDYRLTHDPVKIAQDFWASFKLEE